MVSPRLFVARVIGVVALTTFVACKTYPENASWRSAPGRVASGTKPASANTVNTAGGSAYLAASTPWATATAPTIAFTSTGTTGDRPQRKVWTYAGKNWAIMPLASGTWLWRLQNYTWTPVIKISTHSTARASIVTSGPLVHVLLYTGNPSYLITLEHVAGTSTGYRPWRAQPALVPVKLDSGVEVATIAKDSKGRLWVASDIVSSVVVRSAPSPYTSWSTPFVVASGVGSTDIAGVVSLPNKSIGVFWSNQSTKRFGFRTRSDAAALTTWNAAEVPASGAAQDTVGSGMADAHFSLAVAPDSTVYAAVKTKYNSTSLPQIGVLVRRPAGTWDNTLYYVDSVGVKPTIAIDSKNSMIRVAYTQYAAGGSVYYSESPASAVLFGGRRTLFSGVYNDASMSEDIGDGSAILLATEGTSVRGARINSVTRGSDITVSYNSGESPSLTTARVQMAIDTASITGAAVLLTPGQTYDLDSELIVTYPGPTFIDGAHSMLRRVSGTGAVIRVESAQDGFTIRNMRVFASDGAYSEGASDCVVTWAHDDAQYGVYLQNTRFATLRNLVIRHASVAGIKIAPTIGQNEGTMVEDTMLRMNNEGIQITGTSTNRVRSTKISNVSSSLMRHNGLTIQFADDLQMHGGSVEKAMLDLMNISDSNRLQFFTYFENYGGFAWRTNVGQWCPRDAEGNSIEMARVSQMLFRGCNGAETARGATGAAVKVAESSCYLVTSKEAMLAKTCEAAAITTPTISPRLETSTPGEVVGPAIFIQPTDGMSIVLSKFQQAANERLGVKLQPGGAYNWSPVALQSPANTPTYLDGQGATINLVDTYGAEALLKFTQPMNWLDRDRFFIKDLTLNINGRASYGLVLLGSVGAWARRVTINMPTVSGIRLEGRPGNGAYYAAFRDVSITNTPNGIDIGSGTNEKYTNANMTENLITRDVGTVHKMSWTATHEFINTSATWTSAYGGEKYILNANYSSDIDIRGLTITGTPASSSLYLKTGWSVGLYSENTLL